MTFMAKPKIWLFGGVLALTVAVAACQDATAIPDTALVAGKYVLTTVNDSALPRTVRKDTNYQLQIVQDTIALSAYGTWADLTIYAETSGSQTLPTQSITAGTFNMSGSTLNFRTNSGESFNGTVASGALTIVGTAKAVYVKF